MCHGRKQGRMWAKCGRRQVQGKSMAAKSGKSKVRRVSKPKRMDGWPTSVDACGLCAAQDTLAGRQAVGVEGEAAAAAVPLLLLLLLLLMPGPGENWWVLELGLGAGGAEARCEERHRGAVEGFFILLCRFRAARQVERRTPLRRWTRQIR
ncbi:hypothetical protein M758_1G167100 [Ceratodon purpureus]|nr:hypothetical protein M758_1G167100 [Ceratodon purpureus]